MGPSEMPCIPCPVAMIKLLHVFEVAMIGRPSGVRGRSPRHTSRVSYSSTPTRYSRTARRIASTRRGLIEKFKPANSRVPANRRIPPIGVTVTFDSVNHIGIDNAGSGDLIVMLYPLAGCIGRVTPSFPIIPGDQEPAASTTWSATNSPLFVWTVEIVFPDCLKPKTSVEGEKVTPMLRALDSNQFTN